MVMSHMPRSSWKCCGFSVSEDLRVSGSGMDNSVMVGAGGGYAISEVSPPCLPTLILPMKLKIFLSLVKSACNTKASRRSGPQNSHFWLCMLVNLSDAQFPLKNPMVAGGRMYITDYTCVKSLASHCPINSDATTTLIITITITVSKAVYLPHMAASMMVPPPVPSQ